MSFMSLADSPFLLIESREHPMHVGSVMILRKPEDAGPGYLGDLHRHLLTFDKLRPMFRKHPKSPVNSAGLLMWTEEREVDMEYHVRMSALPYPGNEGQLLDLIGRMHSTLLDRHRPLWEFHLIDGLMGDRFAIYIKLHHALVDGVGGVSIVKRGLSETPDIKSTLPFWAQDGSAPPKTRRAPIRSPWDTAKMVANGVAGTVKTFAKSGTQMLRDDALVTPYAAPRTMFNVPITGARRVAYRGFPLQRLKDVAVAHGATVNDIVLAMSSGGLRRYLEDKDGLPEQSLTAAVPVSLKDKNDAGEGNLISLILCELGTNIEEPKERLDAIKMSIGAAKQTLKGADAVQAMAFSGVVVGGPAVLNLVPGMTKARPPYNLIISNVPGPKNAAYWNGCLVERVYPMSLALEGQALNITVVSYNGMIGFGLVGCRSGVPHMGRILAYMEESLEELERASGLSTAWLTYAE
ncbi:WS/DGAT/MGAT family O-acyltransferase [Smaragdicoccus niigatensis]|uniref:WS/DGAT/MGAT family O-acyltransferase n=1 Tax=Smaragdicoccus niigatensis TaxID=359359 RepID=UPI00035E4041|nr:wax ester/triacylglycerol synthase family O-acyltransferase [Smaragdicoccus niigatensis]